MNYTAKFIFSIHTTDNIELSIFESLQTENAEVWKKGDKGKYAHSLLDSGWSTEKTVNNETIGVELNNFISSLSEFESTISHIQKQYNLSSKLDIIIWIKTGHSPSVFLTTTAIKLLSFLGSEIDIDIYQI